MQIVSLGNANAMGTTVAGLAMVDACSASLDRALEVAGPSLASVSNLICIFPLVIMYVCGREVCR